MGRALPAIGAFGRAIASAVLPAGEPTPLVGNAVRVIGRLGEYEDFARSDGLAFFRVSDEVWNSLDDAGRWSLNRAFLDDAIESGDEFIIKAGDFIPSGSFLDREIRYLRDRGYVWSEDGSRLLPGGNE
jgi:hypothetical protein